MEKKILLKKFNDGKNTIIPFFIRDIPKCRENEVVNTVISLSVSMIELLSFLFVQRSIVNPNWSEYIPIAGVCLYIN